MTQPMRFTDPGTGHTTFCEAGGQIAAKVTEAEEAMLTRMEDDIKRAMELLTDKDVTEGEFIKALYYLGYSAKATLDIAHNRGERLEAYESSKEETPTA